MTTDPVEVLDVIVQDVIVGSFYHLDTNRWEFLGPWDDRHRMRTDSEEDFTTRDPRTFWLYTDGGFRRDPVRAAIGAVLYDPRGRVVDTLSRTSRAPSNNTAEYRALIEGLKMALLHNAHSLVVRSDSLLAVRQLRGTNRVREPRLKLLHATAIDLLRESPRTHVEYVPRRYNQGADRLANAAFTNA
ncbi:MAG: ribonuclease HI family protein [bacterium]|nr:ribonuclease HI family protein [Acidimicrobiia bacterium]MCY4650833.1 ribonuclease HI family protein [bacterium]